MALNFAQYSLRSKCCLLASANLRNYPSSLLPFSTKGLELRGNSVIVAAMKKENKNSNERKKDDRHHFVPKPDEATGPFPEAILLKEKRIEEDGRLLPEFADVEERELFESLNLQLESDLDVEQMRHYEVVYLIHEDRKEEVENVNSKVQEFLKEKKGRLWRFSDWGMRRLAYNIRKAKNAYYILMNFELEARWIDDFKSMLDKDERVIRHLVMKKDKAETEYCPPPAEFRSLRADMEDEDDDEDEDKDEDSYADDDGEMYDDEGVIYVDDEANEIQMNVDVGKNRQNMHKAGR